MAREAERLPAVSVQLVKTLEATQKDWQRPGPVHYASSVHASCLPSPSPLPHTDGQCSVGLLSLFMCLEPSWIAVKNSTKEEQEV